MNDSKSSNHFDVVVIGAGFAGMYMLHKLRETGLKTIVLEAGSGVGGTWFDLRKDIEFDTQVKSAHYEETHQTWLINTEPGINYESRYCIMATGCLSVTNTPKIPGAENFNGPIYHTGQWPHEGVDFREVSVGIIGTGSSGIQAIPVIAEQTANIGVQRKSASKLRSNSS